MPVFEIQTPDGKSFEVDAPDQETAIQSLGEFTRSSVPQTSAGGKMDRETSWADTGMDVLKSAGSGLVQGAVSLATMPQDLGNWAGEKVTGAIDSLMGRSPEQIAADRARTSQAMNTPLAAPNGQQAMQAVEGITGPMYQPQTTAGQYAKTIGEFAPTALAGPGGMARKAAMTVAPAVASEAAGQATEGTAWEPYARVAGAMAGGVAAAAPGAKAGTKQMLKEAPTFDKVKVDTDAAYKALDNAKIVFDQNAYRGTAMRIQNDLRKEGLLPEQGGDISTFLNQILGRAKTGKLNGWTEVDSIRKNLGPIAASSDPKMAMDARRARIIRDHLDNLVTFGKVTSLSGVARDQVGPMVSKARELARREIIGRNIKSMTNTADWYLPGQESGLRNKFSQYGKKNGENLQPMEEAAFKRVVKREGVLNPLHNAGSRIGQMAIGGTTWGATGSITASIASVVGSNLARKFMEVYTMKGVNDAMKTVLAGKTAQQKAAVLDALKTGEAKAQALLATDAGRRSVAQEPFLTDAQGNQYPFPANVGNGR
jgi:hypothetical protein